MREIKPTCLDGGTVHAWHSAGLDVRGDKLVSVKTCVWCDKEVTSKPKLRNRSLAAR